MHNNTSKTMKFYLSIFIVFALILAITFSLYFTVGAGRQSSGNTDSSSTGGVEKLSTEVYVNGSKASSAITGTPSSFASKPITIKNTSNVPVYIRAKVSIIYDSGASTSGMYITFEDEWTYSADNYLYYKDVVASGSSTTSLLNSIVNYTTDTNVRVWVVAEAIQQEAAVPNVSITGVGDPVDSSFSNGLLNKGYKLNSLTSETDSDDITIVNTGKQDLDVKLRIASSEYTISAVEINSVEVDFVRDENSGYFNVLAKLPVSQNCVITLVDANKNNGIIAGYNTAGTSVGSVIEFILQDYVVANDFYSIVDGTTLQNYASTNGVYELTSAQATNAKVYSYNNVPKYAYVQIMNNQTATFASNGWGFIEGTQTAVSSSAILPKSTSSVLFTSASGNVQLKVWSAIPVQSPTISLVQYGSLNDASEYYVPLDVSSVSVTQKATASLYKNLTSTNITTSDITSLWGNLAIKSSDFSDLLVRVALSFTWGSYANDTWTADATQPSLGFDPSVFYGDGFAYNSEDESLTYSYNLPKNHATSAILDFNSTTERTTALASMASAINSAKANSTGKMLKLTVMVEAVYAEGSQLDVYDMTNSTKITTDDFYLNVKGATSLVDSQTLITVTNLTSVTLDWSKYSVYATNNFPIGLRVSVALQWGTASGNTWTPSTTNPISTINLDDYIDKTYWNFDAELGGYKYHCSLPGKAATKGIFKSDLSALASAIKTESASHSGEIVRLVIMVETTHKI